MHLATFWCVLCSSLPFVLLFGRSWHSRFFAVVRFRIEDVVVWVWKLTPIAVSVIFGTAQSTSFPARCLMLVVTLFVARFQLVERFCTRRVASLRRFMFVAFAVVITFQGCLLASDADYVYHGYLQSRLVVVGFGFVFVFMLSVCVGLIAFATLSAKTACGRLSGVPVPGRKRSLHKSALTINVWVEDYVQFKRF